MITSEIHAKTDALPDRSWQGFPNFTSMLPLVVLDIFWAVLCSTGQWTLHCVRRIFFSLYLRNKDETKLGLGINAMSCKTENTAHWNVMFISAGSAYDSWQ